MARRSKKTTKVRRKLGVSEAADHLAILIEELKPLTDEATIFKRRAEMLLDLCTDQLCRAIEANARARAKGKAKCSTRDERQAKRWCDKMNKGRPPATTTKPAAHSPSPLTSHRTSRLSRDSANAR